MDREQIVEYQREGQVTINGQEYIEGEIKVGAGSWFVSCKYAVQAAFVSNARRVRGLENPHSDLNFLLTLLQIIPEPSVPVYCTTPRCVYKSLCTVA